MKTENENSLERSRIIATAQLLRHLAPQAHTFTRKSVLLTGEANVLATNNGRECFLSGFRLLLRMVERLTVWVPPGSLMELVLLEADRISYRTRPTIELARDPEPREFDAVLCVGVTGRFEGGSKTPPGYCANQSG